MRSWLLKLFSENPEVSFSRVATAIITAFVMGWDTSYIVEAWKLAKAGYHIPLMPDGAVFIAQTGFISALYLYNKGAQAISNNRGRDDRDDNNKT